MNSLLTIYISHFTGELGGLLGLLLGASVLTLVELMDMLIYNGIIKCIISYKERHGNKEVEYTAQQNGTIPNGTTDHKKNHVVPLQNV